MMDFFVLILPTALLAGLLLFFFVWFMRMRQSLSAPGGLPPAKRETRITRRDALYAAALTVLYAVTAFVGLGDRAAPESCCRFKAWGSFAVVNFSEPQELGEILYYSGLHTGSYYLQVSENGTDYQNAGVMEQTYTHLFKWNSFKPDVLGVKLRSLRLIADKALELGELALYDADGARIPADTLEYDAGVAPLFDEQSLVPAEGYALNNSTYFDEIYHPRTAYEHVRGVTPYEVSHPPLGKLILSLGIRIFGMTPFGWRFMGTLFGALMLPVLYIFLKKLFGSTPIALAGAALFATDFMHYVQTRLATIDTYAVFFILLMYLFLYGFLSENPDTPDFSRKRQTRSLFFSGLFFGLGAASKWTCLYAGAGLALLWLAYWIFRGVQLVREARTGEYVRELLGNILLCLVFFVLIPAVIYYLSYTPYGRARDMRGAGMYFSRDYLRLVLDNQKYMFRYHAGVNATHPYSSRWYQWILDMRPILYYQQFPTDGTKAIIAAFVSPLICWGGLIALGATAYLGVRTKDKTALFLLVGYLAQLVPWIPVRRVVFAYHYFTCVPFLILCICYCFDALRRVDALWRRPLRRFVIVSIVLFAAFFPVLHGSEAPRWYFKLLRWLPAWPI